jgi:hypothetical protein
MKPMEIHRVLNEARELVRQIAVGDKLENISSDTAMAIGESLGVLDKAKALVGRDIDNLRFTKGGS